MLGREPFASRKTEAHKQKSPAAFATGRMKLEGLSSQLAHRPFIWICANRVCYSSPTAMRAGRGDNRLG
jgi:hypothetical protein